MKRLAPLLLLVFACSDSTETARAPLNLDRPVDVAFGCWGGLRLVGDDGVGDAGDEVVVSPQPMESCRIRSRDPEKLTEDGRSAATSGDCENGDDDDGDGLIDAEDPQCTLEPPGQALIEGAETLDGVDYYSFILQSVPGTVAISTFDTKPASTFTGIDVAFVDADPLTPGRNSIAVGSLPIAIAPDRYGCHMITANAGSCDLSVIDVNSVVDDDESTPPDVRSLEVTNGLGEPVLAKPAAMVAEAPGGEIGVACPAEPEGLLYVAYPDCHLVAAIRAGTGVIEAGLRFNEDGTVDQITGDLASCPAQCGGGGTFVGGERPTTLDLLKDDRVGTERLVIGAENSPNLTVVELDPATGAPLSFARVALAPERDGTQIGVLDVALTEQIAMGGTQGVLNDDNGAGGQHQFVYAVASDATIRVADVLGTNVECDTQIDPRYLRGVSDVGLLSCFPVGDLTNPPRRATARGPGIELIANSVPMSVATVAVDAVDTGSPTDPGTLIGHFAFVTATTGETVIINIDDDNYKDAWDALGPLGTQIPLLLAHQLRDSVGQRDDLAETTINAGTSEEEVVPVCDDNGPTDAGGPRIAGGNFDFGFASDRLAADKAYILPGIRRIECVDGSDGTKTAISSLSFSAPVALRDASFPDLRGIRFNESWNLTWEGSLSRDDSDVSIDGPIERAGVVHREGQSMIVEDPSRPFCSAGVQPYDILLMTGCDPAVGDAECRIGETCYVHPDATVSTGTCLPAGEADLLAGTCRDFLISSRRFSILESTAGELTVVPRRHVLASSPLDGCVDDTQCATLAQYEASLASDEHPIDDTTPPSDKTYRCEADPTRAPGPDRCVMTCDADADCDEGSACNGGYCVEGVIPPAACAEAVQRYQLRAGDAYAVVGSASGYLHPIIEGAGGACVVDAEASPLLIGRLPLTAPPCTGDGITDVLPNPCSTTVEHTELVPDYIDTAVSCEVDSDNGKLITRDAPAIRFRNPAVTFDFVDPYYGGDAVCREDRAGTLGMIPASTARHQLELSITSGFFTERANLPSVFPVNVVRGPEQSIWVIDEGDNVPDASSSLSTRGQVFRIEPSNLNIVNVVQ